MRVAAFEVARRVAYRPDDNEHVPPAALPPVRLPRVDPATRLGRLAVLGAPDAAAADVLRLLVAAAVDRNVARVMPALPPIAAGMGIPEPAARAALAALAAHGLVDQTGPGPERVVAHAPG